MNKKYKIVVVGLGYVGLSNAVLLAQHNEVVGVDSSEERVDAINKRKSPIIDHDLTDFFTNKSLNLHGITDLKLALVNADFVIIATPTNYDTNTNEFDTSSVEAVILEVVSFDPKITIIVKSTIPVGFTDNINIRLQTESILFSPEFLREGKALYDNLYPSRIIVGGKHEKSQVFASLLSSASLKDNVEILLTGAKEAEAVKLFSNAFLAMRISFFNELDSYALASGISSREVIDGVSLDPRIGNYYNNPSFGYGGYCLPKDTKQLLKNYNSVPQNIIRAIVDANTTRKDFLSEEIIKKNPKVVGIYRLIMKTGSDNFRESAIQGIMKRLKAKGIEIVVYEPNLNDANYFNSRVEIDFKRFKADASIIIANRMVDELYDVQDKIFTRDLFGLD